nr:MAG TPA: hypothetical protein [Caudoviricetes sp.]
MGKNKKSKRKNRKFPFLHIFLHKSLRLNPQKY